VLGSFEGTIYEINSASVSLWLSKLLGDRIFLPCYLFAQLPSLNDRLILFITFFRMASQPMNNVRPPTVQIRGQPVNQKSGCCSS
jgi:hypothetical protein